MKKLAKIALIGALVVIAAWSLKRNLDQARQLRAVSLAGPEVFLDLSYPGLAGAVSAVRERGVDAVRGLPYEPNRRLYQRLTEMLYPVELIHGAAADFVAGDVVVAKQIEQIDRECTVLYQAPGAVVVVIES